MDIIELTGLVAAFCTTTAFLPQFLKAWKTKSTRDLSLPTFALMTLGILLWLVYGLWTNDLPIIVANIATIIICAGILVLKIKYG